MTHTYAKLEISKAAYDEIAKKLKDAGYDHAFIAPYSSDAVIDMHGIGLVAGSDNVTKSFEEAWAATGYQYGPEALDNVKLGWHLLSENTRSVRGGLQGSGP